MSELFVGVDAGGTRSLCISATRDGLYLGSATGGPANLQVEGFESCTRAIAGAVRELPIPMTRIRCVGAGVPGARLGPDQERLGRMVADKLGCEIVVKGDVEVASLASFPAGKGVVVIAGTGSSAMAVVDGSIVAKAGGWGPMLGDGGSAYWIGLEALRAVVRAVDGCGADTALSDAVRRAFALSSFDELVRVSREQRRDQIASLSRMVYESAKAGDTVAKGILGHAGNELGTIAGTVAKGLGTGLAVALIGGVFKAGDYVITPLLDTVKRMGIEVEVVRPRFPPCVGGLFLAYRRVGIELTESVLGNLEKSMPPSMGKD